jgi:2-(1,2-epoxy-1,2-dihydrophenyl)acetyl-CoA isomerase
MNDTVRIAIREAVASLVLDRAPVYNALDLATMERLAQALAALGADPAVRAVVIGGAGRAFCAGGDLAWVAAFPEGAAAAFHELATRFHRAITEIRRMPTPVIAAIDGPAAGGGFSLALACDFRVMAASAVLKQAYTASGLCFDGGASHALPRLVGLARAPEIAAFDPAISAAQALSWGLVTRVAGDGEALAAALQLARELTDRSGTAFAACKALLTEAFEAPLASQLDRERAALSRCAGLPDGREGLAAFLEKRAPHFLAALPPG